MEKKIELTIEQAESIIAFILMHERDEISEEVWESMNNMREQIDWL